MTVSTDSAELAGLLQKTPLTRRTVLVSTLSVGFAAAVQPVTAQTLTTDTTGLDAGEVKIPTADGEIPAYRAKPAAAGPHATVLVVQEIFGVHEHIKDVCRRFAKQGYCAIAPELYARQGDVSKYTDFRDIVSNVVSKVPDAQVMSDLDATARWADKNGGDAKRVGVTGFCWGGRIVWLYAAHSKDLKAGVAWYGRLLGTTNELQPTYPIDVAAKLKAPVLGLYGGKDDGIPMADVEKMQAALAAAKSPSKIVVFPDAPHGFHADYRPSYRPDAAKDALATVPCLVPEARRSLRRRRLRKCSRTQRPKHGRKLFGERRVDAQPLLGDRMREFEPHTGEHQPPHAIEAREEAVVRPFAIGRITDDRVRQVRKVAAELMPTSGVRPQPQECVAAARVAVHAVGYLEGLDPLVARARGLRRPPGRRQHVVLDRSQCVVDLAALVGPATHQREIPLPDLRAREGLGQVACGPGVEREGKRAGGTLIETMHGVDMAAELVAEHLHGEARLACVDRRAVHEQARGLVDDDEPVVAVEDRQRAVAHAAVSGEVSEGDTACLRSG